MSFVLKKKKKGLNLLPNHGCTEPCVCKGGEGSRRLSPGSRGYPRTMRTTIAYKTMITMERLLWFDRFVTRQSSMTRVLSYHHGCASTHLNGMAKLDTVCTRYTNVTPPPPQSTTGGACQPRAAPRKTAKIITYESRAVYSELSVNHGTSYL